MKPMHLKNKHREGFSLLEILGVLAIMGIIAATLMPSIVRQIVNSKINREQNNLKTITEGLINYVEHYQTIPRILRATDEYKPFDPLTFKTPPDNWIDAVSKECSLSHSQIYLTFPDLANPDAFKTIAPGRLLPSGQPRPPAFYSVDTNLGNCRYLLFHPKDFQDAQAYLKDTTANANVTQTPFKNPYEIRGGSSTRTERPTLRALLVSCTRPQLPFPDFITGKSNVVLSSLQQDFEDLWNWTYSPGSPKLPNCSNAFLNSGWIDNYAEHLHIERINFGSLFCKVSVSLMKSSLAAKLCLPGATTTPTATPATPPTVSPSIQWINAPATSSSTSSTTDAIANSFELKTAQLQDQVGDFYVLKGTKISVVGSNGKPLHHVFTILKDTRIEDGKDDLPVIKDLRDELPTAVKPAWDNFISQIQIINVQIINTPELPPFDAWLQYISIHLNDSQKTNLVNWLNAAAASFTIKNFADRISNHWNDPIPDQIKWIEHLDPNNLSASP